MRDVLNLNAGSIVQLDKLADAPVELRVNDRLIARGEVVVLENRFGIKITELLGGAQ
jgi:flagellar motor switch protein FliN/FliY